MIDRDELRRKKQYECEQRIRAIHQSAPRLAQIADRIAYLSLGCLKNSVLTKNNQGVNNIKSEVDALLAERKEILAKMNLDESIYEPSWDCPLCKDQGYVIPGEPCQCVLAEKKQDLVAKSGIPQALREKNFENFRIIYYTEPEKMAQKVEICKNIADKIIKGIPCDNLVFLGDVGRGKTHLSLAVANKVLSGGKKVIYKRMNELLDEIRTAKYDSGDNDYLYELINCDLLVIDDFGADNATDFAKTQMRTLIDERNLNDKAWIISTNLDINLIQDLYSARFVDRMLEKARIFAFESERSIREILREERMK